VEKGMLQQTGQRGRRAVGGARRRRRSANGHLLVLAPFLSGRS
jgi:hypothetical protein